MAYRKILVDGVEHQFTVGRTHLKVRGLPAVPKEQVGTLQEDKYSEGNMLIRVEPNHVADYIRRSA